MNRFTVRRCLLHGCRLSLPVLLVTALLVPGCAGKRVDLFSTLDEFESAETAEKDSPEADDKGLIAKQDADEKDEKQLVAASSNDADAKSTDDVSTPVSLRQRLRSFVGLGGDKQEVATTDPFVDDDDAADEAAADNSSSKTAADASQDAIAETGRPSVDELLASFATKTPAVTAAGTKPWWEADDAPATGSEQASANTASADPQFAQEFDSRLERLRAELATVNSDSNSAASDAVDGPAVDPFLAASSSPTSANAEDASARSLFGGDQHPLDSNTSATLGAAKPRIKAMLADARTDWENWNLRRAYRTALDAQELAVLENVTFTADEVSPQELAEQIAADLRGDSVSAVAASREKKPASSSLESLFTTSAKSSSAIGFPDFSDAASPWSTPANSLNDTRAGLPSEDASQPTESRTSGVSLLPPDDDFPSETDSTDWNRALPSFGAVPPQPTTTVTEDSIQLTNHKSPEFTLTRSQTPQDQFPGLSNEDNQELLTSVAAQRSRVLQPNDVEWPSLPAPAADVAGSSHRPGPIRLAEAPRFTLDDDLAPAMDAPAATPAARAPVSGSLLGQFWRSQPIWFIGGLVLLVIALRLLPWPRQAGE